MTPNEDKKILIIDDDPAIRAQLTAALTESLPGSEIIAPDGSLPDKELILPQSVVEERMRGVREEFERYQRRRERLSRKHPETVESVSCWVCKNGKTTLYKTEQGNYVCGEHRS